MYRCIHIAALYVVSVLPHRETSVCVYTYTKCILVNCTTIVRASFASDIGKLSHSHPWQYDKPTIIIIVARHTGLALYGSKAQVSIKPWQRGIVYDTHSLVTLRSRVQTKFLNFMVFVISHVRLTNLRCYYRYSVLCIG